MDYTSGQTLKRCCVCKVEKSLDQYHAQRKKPDGRQTTCKECCKIQQARYRQQNWDRDQSLQRRWRQEHEGYHSVYNANYHAIDGQEIKLDDWLGLLKKFDGKCPRCGQDARLSLDHVQPRAKNGPNVIENVQPLCMPCNTSKGDKSEDYRLGA